MLQMLLLLLLLLLLLWWWLWLLLLLLGLLWLRLLEGRLRTGRIVEFGLLARRGRVRGVLGGVSLPARVGSGRRGIAVGIASLLGLLLVAGSLLLLLLLVRHVVLLSTRPSSSRRNTTAFHGLDIGRGSVFIFGQDGIGRRMVGGVCHGQADEQRGRKKAERRWEKKNPRAEKQKSRKRRREEKERGMGGSIGLWQE